MIRMQLTMKGLLLLMLVLFSATTVLAQPSMWKNYSFNWVDHTPNPRFAIHDPETPGDETDDLVLDKMTRLIWMRNAGYLGSGITWPEAMQLCRIDITVCNVKGWRLPTVEELSTLIDTTSNSPHAPAGHPFYGLTGNYFWTSTTCEGDSNAAWVVNFYDGSVFYWHNKIEGTAFVLPVLGGSGYASGNW